MMKLSRRLALLIIIININVLGYWMVGYGKVQYSSNETAREFTPHSGHLR